MTPGQLDREVRAELRTLAKPLADRVARHLVSAGELLEVDPETALAHALAARRRAPRVAAVREAVGLAAYQAGQWQTAITELRTYHRMVGSQPHLALLADCERALGRPEKALDLYRAGQRADLTPQESTELLIVAAGARADLGQTDTALDMLDVPQLNSDQPGVARLRYAYADRLLQAGRVEEAREWFTRAMEADEDSETDAAERLLQLEGVSLEEAEEPIAEEPIAEEPATDRAEPDQVEPKPESKPDGPLVDQYDLVILDLDGVVLLGEEPIPAAVTALAELRQRKHRVLFATNNASRGPDEVAALLTRIGIPADSSEVLTSAMVAAAVLAQQLPADAPVLVVGSESLAEEVRQQGLRPVESADAQPVAVVQGYAPQVGWAQLAEACLAIRAGAQWVVTNTDATLPSPRGQLPGNGSLVAALQTAAGRSPDLVVGKPQPQFFTTAVQRAGARAPLVVGDRLDTDIEGANRAGLDSLLVLTGVADREQVNTAPPTRRARFIGEDLTSLLAPGEPVS